MALKLYFEKLPEPIEIDVMDEYAVKARLLTVMQNNRGVVSITVKGGRSVIVDTGSIRMVV